MSRGTILAHKHTLCEAFTGFFRALATERFSEVRHWLHPELEQLIRKQCDRVGEAAFLRNLKLGLGSATQRVRLGASQAEGARPHRASRTHRTTGRYGPVCSLARRLENLFPGSLHQFRSTTHAAAAASRADRESACTSGEAEKLFQAAQDVAEEVVCYHLRVALTSRTRATGGFAHGKDLSC